MMRRLLTSVASIALLISTTPAPLQAQPMVPPPGPPAAAPAEAYSAEQLDAILAPIALYPDQLLTQVLMASAYPEQVTEAANWAQAQGNQALRGDALAQALAPLPWDPSVKSLVPFPQVLGMMNANPGWVQQLGFAVAVQQDQVLELDPTPAPAGRVGRQAAVDAAADRTHRAAGHLHRAGPAGRGLRAGLRSAGGVRHLALPGLPANLPAAAAWPLHRRGARRRIVLRCWHSDCRRVLGLGDPALARPLRLC